MIGQAQPAASFPEVPMSEEPENTQEWGTAKVVETTEEAILVAGFLQNSGIPAEVESLHASELPVDVGALGEVRVRVPADRLDEALAALSVQEAIPRPTDGT
jgi:hypothetical protein